MRKVLVVRRTGSMSRRKLLGDKDRIVALAWFAVCLLEVGKRWDATMTLTQVPGLRVGPWQGHGPLSGRYFRLLGAAPSCGPLACPCEVLAWITCTSYQNRTPKCMDTVAQDTIVVVEKA